MGFPLQKIASAGSRIRMARIASGTRPTEYNFTVVEAAAANDTSVKLKATAAGDVVKIQHDEILVVGNGATAVKIIVNLPDGAGLTDAIEITAAAGGVTVPCLKLSGALTANAAIKTYALRELLGVTDCSPPIQPQTVDTTDMRSGFGSSTLVVGANKTLTVTGQRVVGDRCMFEIVMPYLTQDERMRELLYVEAMLPNGDLYRGPARITDSGAQNQVRQALGYNLTMTFEGNITDFFTSGDAALFA
jgi:hypothetical protein